MAANVEIKARAPRFAQQYSLALALVGQPSAVLQQEDIFFHVPTGRLKLRIFSSAKGELIAYQRPDQQGPKTSQYQISPTSDPLQLKATLAAALELRGVVRKTRTLFLKERTRIHFDEVVDLGEFLELEVVLGEDCSQEQGRIIAQDLMQRLDIRQEDLIEAAYIDLLQPAESGSGD